MGGGFPMMRMRRGLHFGGGGGRHLGVSMEMPLACESLWGGCPHCCPYGGIPNTGGGNWDPHFWGPLPPSPPL